MEVYNGEDSSGVFMFSIDFSLERTDEMGQLPKQTAMMKETLAIYSFVQIFFSDYAIHN